MEQSHEIATNVVNQLSIEYNKYNVAMNRLEYLLYKPIMLALPPHHEYKKCDGLRLHNCHYQMFACKEETEKQVVEELKKRSRRIFPFNINEVILVGHVKDLSPIDIMEYFPVSWPRRLGKGKNATSYGHLTAIQVFKARWKEIGLPDYICITKTKIKPSDLIDDKEKTLW